jgi:tetrahydromethanopterin S-methyltransferase subunit C
MMTVTPEPAVHAQGALSLVAAHVYGAERVRRLAGGGDLGGLVL